MGWSGDIVSGGAAASLETGVPQSMMSMLIRAGLPSRRAAMAAFRATTPGFFSVSDMRAWLVSEKIAALTEAGDFPSPEAAMLWQRFREDMLGAAQEKWRARSRDRALAIRTTAKPPPAGVYRVEFDHPGGGAWLTTPDYRRVAKFKTTVTGPRRGLFAARVAPDERMATVERFGPGTVTWPP